MQPLRTIYTDTHFDIATAVNQITPFLINEGAIGRKAYRDCGRAGIEMLQQIEGKSIIIKGNCQRLTAMEYQIRILVQEAGICPHEKTQRLLHGFVAHSMDRGPVGEVTVLTINVTKRAGLQKCE